MELEETYNLHKKINCIFPHFKSKRMCKNGKHNYRINPQEQVIPHYYQKMDSTGRMIISRIIEYERIDTTNLKCYCCGKEENLEGINGIRRSCKRYKKNM